MFQRAQAGDPLAFQELIRPHLDSVRRFVFSLTSHWQDADDITQEALIKAFRAFHSFDQRASLSTWLFTVARNASIDWHRSRLGQAAARERPITELHPARSEGQEQACSDKQDRERLWAAIHQLDERYRVPLVLFEIEGLSYEEIAAIEQVPVGTIRSRLSRARQGLAESLLAGEVASNVSHPPSDNSAAALRRSHG